MSSQEKREDEGGATQQEEDESPADVKVILLGDSAVGKSKLVERFLMDDYVPRQLSTFALTVFRHTAKVAEKDVVVDFWDTAGQERFTNMHPSYYHKAHVCVLVFDCTRKVTYQHLGQWYEELRRYRQCPTIVVANKIDVDYKVTRKAFAFPEKRGLPFFFCSAADGTNVVRVFEAAIKAAVEYKEKPADDFADEVVSALQYFSTSATAAGAATADGGGEDGGEEVAGGGGA